jgi:nitrite reductase/ring-hydroxylating ferredoxin subunit
MSASEFVPALTLAEIPRGSMRTRVLEGQEIVFCHTREGVFALNNICTHAHTRMCEGRLRATRITCPLHGASFDIRDGRVLSAPAVVPLATYPIRVVNGTIEIALPRTPPA